MSSGEFHPNPVKNELVWWTLGGLKMPSKSVSKRDRSESHRARSILAFSGFNG